MFLILVAFISLSKLTLTNLIELVHDVQSDILIDITDTINNLNLPISILGNNDEFEESFKESLENMFDKIYQACISDEDENIISVQRKFCEENWYVLNIILFYRQIESLNTKFICLYSQILCNKEVIYNLCLNIKQVLIRLKNILESNTVLCPDNTCTLLEICSFLCGDMSVSKTLNIKFVFKSLCVKEHLFREAKKIYFRVISMYEEWVKYIFERRTLNVCRMVLGLDSRVVYYFPGSLITQNCIETLDLIFAIARKFMFNLSLKETISFSHQENIFWMQNFVTYIKNQYFNYIEDSTKLNLKHSPDSLEIVVNNNLKKWIEEFIKGENDAIYMLLNDQYNDKLEILIKRPQVLFTVIKTRAIKIEMIYRFYLENLENMRKCILKLSSNKEKCVKINKELATIHRKIFNTEIVLEGRTLVNKLMLIEKSFYPLKNALLILLNMNLSYFSNYYKAITSVLKSNFDKNTKLNQEYKNIIHEIDVIIGKMNFECDKILGIEFVYDRVFTDFSVYDPITHMYLKHFESF